MLIDEKKKILIYQPFPSIHLQYYPSKLLKNNPLACFQQMFIEKRNDCLYQIMDLFDQVDSLIMLLTDTNYPATKKPLEGIQKSNISSISTNDKLWSDWG